MGLYSIGGKTQKTTKPNEYLLGQVTNNKVGKGNRYPF